MYAAECYRYMRSSAMPGILGIDPPAWLLLALAMWANYSNGLAGEQEGGKAGEWAGEQTSRQEV